MKGVQIAVHGLMAFAAAMPLSATAADDEAQNDAPAAGLVRIVREATQHFNDVGVAIAHGYVSTRSCVSGPDEGAMGVHYVNPAWVADGVLDARRPELLVYEPRSGGRLRLVAVEYFVDAQQWNAANAGPAMLLGQEFHYVGAPNRLRLPAHYQLHVWAWKHNPKGMFVNWNPNVSCTGYTGE